MARVYAFSCHSRVWRRPCDCLRRSNFTFSYTIQTNAVLAAPTPTYHIIQGGIRLIAIKGEALKSLLAATNLSVRDTNPWVHLWFGFAADCGRLMFLVPLLSATRPTEEESSPWQEKYIKDDGFLLQWKYDIAVTQNRWDDRNDKRSTWESATM